MGFVGEEDGDEKGPVRNGLQCRHLDWWGSLGWRGAWSIGIGVPFGPFWAPYWAPYSAAYAYPYGYPYAYACPYAYPPVVSQPPAPTYQAPPQTASWYYCAAERGYYPYVRQCPGGWQQMPASPQ